jgi:cytochrome c-type biogenesis protein
MELNVWISLVAGFLSFISPCTLPLYPSYLSYITGVSVGQMQSDTGKTELRRRILSHTLFFVLGFSIIFYTLGAAAGVVADLFIEQRRLISMIAGILMVVFGLFMLGIFQPQFLLRERKFRFRKPAGYFGSFLVGIGFAAGWSPCIGPILGSIITLASTAPGQWLAMITAYTLGFAVPFFLLAFFLGSVRPLVKYSQTLLKIGGVFIIFIGILLYTDQMTKIAAFLGSITPDWLMF